MSITMDTGAQVSVVLRECVRDKQLTGNRQKVRSFQGSLVEGEACVVDFVLGDRVFEREAVAVEGDLINWTPCFRVPLTPRSDLEFVMDLAEKKQAAGKEQLYVPPRMHNGTLQTGYLVSGGDEDSEMQTPSTSKTVVGSGKAVKITNSEELTAEEECAKLMAIDVSDDVVGKEVIDKVYGDHGNMEEDISMKEASVSVEAGGDAGGCAGLEEELLVIEGIKGNRLQLVEATKNDETWHVARSLGEKNKEGYRYQDGVLLRTRLDKQGDKKEQICLPKELRRECMMLAHSRFGHMGRNKMCQLISPFFYWPTLSRDCQQHIRQCSVCQKADKMPFERVAVDIVGPFPTAKGGFRFLLTFVDLATR